MLNSSRNFYKLSLRVLCLVCSVLLVGAPGGTSTPLTAIPTLAPRPAALPSQLFIELSERPKAMLDKAQRQLKLLPVGSPATLPWLVEAAEAARVLNLHRISLEYAKQGLALPSINEYQKHLLLMALANAYDNNGQSDLGLGIVNEELIRLAKTNDTVQTVDALYQRGILNCTVGNTKAALADLRRALTLLGPGPARIQRSDILTVMATVYQTYAGTMKKAEETFIDVIEELGPAGPSARLVEAQYRYAWYLSKSRREAEASTWFLKAKDNASKLGAAQSVAYAIYGLGRLAAKQNKGVLARKLLDEARPSFLAANDLLTVAYIDKKQAEISFQQKNNRDALDRLNTLMDLAVEIKNDPLKLGILRLRSRIKLAMGQANEAYTDLDKSYDLFEDVSQLQQEEKIAQLESSFVLEKEAQDNVILKQQAALNAAEIRNQQQRLRLYVSLFAFTIFCVGIFMWHRQRQHLLLKKISETDTLTKLPNRRSFVQFNEREMARAERHGLAYSIAILDLDFFKKVNDTYGHQAGDQVLSEFARVASLALRSEDMLARFGGEEFVLCMPHTDGENALVAITRIRVNLASMVLPLLKGAATPTFSAGVACFGVNGSDADTLIASADQALYMAKDNGRNRTELAPRERVCTLAQAQIGQVAER